MVATIRPNSLQEGQPRTSTGCPRFRSWRPACCPAKLLRSGVPVVKQKQDSLPQHVQKTVKRRNQRSAFTRVSMPRSFGSMFFSRFGVVEVGAVISMPGDAVLEWTWFAFRRTQKSWHSRHHPRVNRSGRIRSSQVTALFALAVFPHVTHFLQHTASKLSVSFVTQTAHVCRYLSLNFWHFVCGEGAHCNWACLPRVRRKAAVSFEPRRFSRSSMICAVAQRVWRTMFKSSSQGLRIIKMGVLLRVSTILRLRDHLYAQEQMFTRRAARVALCFCVRIHGVMASPSVMLKVVFLLEVTLEGWLIARRERCFVRSEWRASKCGRGTDVHGRHVAFHHESPRHGVASYATTPHHMTARTASSTRERGTLHTSSLARHP